MKHPLNALLAGLGLAVAIAAPALAEIKVGVILSTTGPAASVGINEYKTLPLMPTEIAGEKIRYIVLDDASDTTTAVKHVKKLLGEDRIDVLVGPTLTATSLALLDSIAEAKTPMISLAGSAIVVSPMDAKRRWAFKTPPNDAQMASGIIDHMVANGVKTIGFIGFNDAYGEGWWGEFKPLADKAGIKIVASERYQRPDTSVTGQVLKLIAANPDAVFIAASATPAVLPQATLIERGYKKPIYQTHGIANADFLRIGGKNVEGTIAPAGPVVVAAQLPDSHPVKKAALDFIKRYEAQPDAGKVSTFAAHMWDAGLVLQAVLPGVLKQTKPGSLEFREKLRDAIEQTKEVVASNGVISMSPSDHVGLDGRARVMVRIENNNWKLIK